MTASTTRRTPEETSGPASRPSHPAQHVVRCLRIDGEFDTGTARAALDTVTRNHGGLRSAFPSAADAAGAELTELPVTEQKASGQVVRTATEPFDLGHGPLLRIRVLRLSRTARLLVAVAHRLLLDPVSLDALLVEHARAYTAARHGMPEPSAAPDRPAAPTPERTAADLAHWRARLKAPAVLDLPTDRPRTPRSQRRGGTQRFAVPQDVVRQLSGGAGTEAALLAGAVALLARHVVAPHTVPLLVAVRPEAPGGGIGARPETDIVLTFGLQHDPSFRELTEQARAALAEARAHGDALPPGALEDLVGAAGDPGRQPVPAAFAARTVPAGRPDYDGAVCTPIEPAIGIAARDLSLSFTLTPTAVHGTLEYDADLYEPVTAGRLVRRTEHLLAGAAAGPDTPVSALPVLPPEERALVVTGWNRTARPFPRDSTTAQLFEEQVCRDPDAVAVEHEDVKVTYGELNARANWLAHRLLALGVGPDVPVGVCLPRSVDMVTAVLAALKAGGAYLPLDPAHPEQRLAHIVEDAHARVVLTSRDRAAAFATTSAHVLHPEPGSGPGDAADPVTATTAEHLAYVIYTSGSTGRPKGVAVSHRALSRLVKGADYLRLGPQEVHLQLSPLTFDASLIELWGALLNGGTVVLPPSGLPFPEQLRVALERHRITTLLLVSPQLHVAAEQFPEALARVRQLMVGGDTLSPASAASLLPHLDDTRFLHMYGPTECTLFATGRPIETVDTTRPTIPIGRPIANTQAYVLDERRRPVPVGVPGELWLAGEGLAREYLGRPELTMERFPSNPFGPPGSRMYRTGDLARLLPDGELEFLGRGDDQVKIRGYRIELGEVDAALAAHPEVGAVATVLREDAPGGRALVAYLVGERLPDDAELRAFVGSRLPSYMTPAAFVRLQEIPLTANGKVDRKALPAPEFSPAAGSAAVGDPVEELVRTAFAETLGLDAVGPDDDFFEIGGNSLLLVDLFTRMQTAFPDDAPTLVDLLEHRTPSAVARLMAKQTATQET